MKEKKKSFKENADLNLMKGNAPCNPLTNTTCSDQWNFVYIIYYFLTDQKNLEMFIYECRQINDGFSFNCLFQIMYGLEKSLWSHHPSQQSREKRPRWARYFTICNSHNYFTPRLCNWGRMSWFHLSYGSRFCEINSIDLTKSPLPILFIHLFLSTQAYM